MSRTSEKNTVSATSRRSLKIPAFLFVVGAMTAGYVVFSVTQSSDADPPNEVTENSASEGEQSDANSKESADKEYRNLIIGRWESDRNGKRDLIVREDGTATMQVTINTWHRHLFAEEIRFDIQWSIQNGILSFVTTGGEPETAVKAVVQLYGKSRDQPIIKIDASQMILKDADKGEPDHLYQRVADNT